MTIDEADNVLNFADWQTQESLLECWSIAEHVSHQAMFRLVERVQLRVVILHEADEVNLHYVIENMEQVCPLDELILVVASHLVYLCLLKLSDA